MYSRRVGYKSNGASSAPGTGAASVPAAAVSSGVGGGIYRACAPAGHIGLVLCGHPASARQARPHRRGIRQRPFACRRFFKAPGETATHRRKACRPYISAGTTCLRIRRKRALLAFKYTGPGVVTVNSSILSLSCCEARLTKPHVLRFLHGSMSQSPVRSTGACAMHTRSPRKRRL